MKYLKVLLLVLCCTSIVACYRPGAAVAPASEEEFEQVFSFYYQQPDPQQLLGALAYLDEPGVFSSNMKAPVMGFLSALALERPDDWKVVKDLVFERETSLNALMQAVPRQAQSVQKLLAQPKAIASSAAELDFLWGAFSATGDARFVQIIIRTAQNEGDPLVKAAANWSLASQRKQHPKVEEIFQQSSTQPDDQSSK